jgi:hypothetical protein
LRAEAEGVAQDAAALATAADETDPHAPVRAGDAILGNGLRRAHRRGEEHASGGSGGVLQKAAAAAASHDGPPVNERP